MARRRTRQSRKPAALPSLGIEVVWGSLTETAGDVHVVGHYQGVLPQNAERALDLAVSARPEQLVITELTKRGVIRGALGDVTFIPWDKGRTAVIAGMGVPGAFHEPQLRKLITSVATTVGALKGLRELNSVLIGSGMGNLPVADCIQGYLDGLADAFEIYPDLGLTRVRLVELNLDRAIVILRLLEERVQAESRGVRFQVRPTLGEAPGRQVPLTFTYSMLLAAVARETRSQRRALSPWLQALLHQLPDLPEVERRVVDALRGHARAERDITRLALAFPITSAADHPHPREIPTRIVFGFDGRHVRSSAITETTTVTEREVGIRQEQLDELTLDLSQAERLSPDELESLGRFAFRRLLHADLAAVFVAGRPTVLEVSRLIAGMPFEMLWPDDFDRPLGVSVPLARQLRTTYSPPAVTAPRRRIAKALVVGDPGEGPYLLPECRHEAAHVRDLLERAGVETTLLVGSPRDHSTPRPKRSHPASIISVQTHLFNGVDLVHYCGHGVYEPDRPEQSGWLFGNGTVLTAEDLQQIRTAPLLVVANACLSSQLSPLDDRPAERTTRGRSGRGRATPPRADSANDLIPGLADELFRLGVRDFIGAAFAVPDARARTFATYFYRALFGPQTSTVGEAVLRARGRLYDEWRRRRGRTRRERAASAPIWGAYQHYGDPTRDLG